MGKGKHRKNQFASSHCTGESWGNLLEDASRQTKQGMGSQPQSGRLLWNKRRVGSAGSTITIMSAQTSKFWRWCRMARRSCLIKKAPLRTDVTDQVLCSWQVYFVNNAKRYLSFIDCVLIRFFHSSWTLMTLSKEGLLWFCLFDDAKAGHFERKTFL